MNDLRKKRKIAIVLTVVTLANIWASFIYQTHDAVLKGIFTATTVMLIGITIERWARFVKAYIDYAIDQKINSQSNPCLNEK